MNFKTVFAATTAIALAGMASAQSNETFLDQMGTVNRAAVNQFGSNNSAGSDDATRNTPSGPTAARHVMTQSGNNNTLELTQRGDNNRFTSETRQNIGLGSDADGFGVGFDQVGNGNFAIVNQETNQNSVARIQQLNGAFLRITQGGAVSAGRNANRVTTVYQENTGGSFNRVVIEQERFDFSNATGGTNGANIIGERGGTAGVNRGEGGVFQIGTDNTAELTQSGSQNSISLVDQDGSENSAIVEQTGNFNGTDTLTSAAGLAGATQSSLLQTGNDNEAFIEMEGNDNAFGITQSGNGNDALSISLQGDSNQIGVAQIGNDNALVNGLIDGNFNNVGVSQRGDDNTTTLSITGDLNGGGLMFSGAAIGIARSRESGRIIQDGIGNGAELSITGDSNAFLIVSTGDNHAVFGTVNGNFNQAAVVQMTSDNISVFSQKGTRNDLGIMQN